MLLGGYAIPLCRGPRRFGEHLFDVFGTQRSKQLLQRHATMLDRQSGRRGPFFPISDPCFVASLSRQVTKRANRFHSSVLQREKKAGHLLRGLQQCHLHEWRRTTALKPYSDQAA